MNFYCTHAGPAAFSRMRRRHCAWVHAGYLLSADFIRCLYITLCRRLYFSDIFITFAKVFHKFIDD